MCKSLAEGGQRCAAHTHQALMRAATTVQHYAVQDDRERYAEAQAAWHVAAVNYASTPTGRKAFLEQQKQAEADGNPAQAGMLASILRQGQDLRERNAAMAAQLSLVNRLSALPEPGFEVPPMPEDRTDNPFTKEEATAWQKAMDNLASATTDSSPRSPFAHAIALQEALSDPEASDARLSRGLSGAGANIAKVCWRRALDHPNAGDQTVAALIEPATRGSAYRGYQLDDDTMIKVLRHPKVSGPLFTQGVIDMHAKAAWTEERERLSGVVKDKVRTGCTHASILALSGPVKVDEHTRDDAFMTLASMKFDAHPYDHIRSVAEAVVEAPYSREAKSAFLDSWENHLAYTKDSAPHYRWIECERLLGEARDTVRRQDGGRLTAISR